MAILWDTPVRRQQARETQTDIAWRLFLLQALTGAARDVAQAPVAIRQGEATEAALAGEDQRAA